MIRTSVKSNQIHGGLKPVNSEDSAPQNLVQVLRRYRTPTIAGSLWQLFSTLAFLFSLTFLMWLALDYSYWLTLAISVPASFFLVRLFIIQHDCGHGSFFASRAHNNLLGRFLSVLTLTPYQCWRKSHAIHHASVGKLHRRGTGGDVLTLTVREYEQMSPWKKFGYRLYRNPLILFGIFPLLVFVVWQRFAYYLPRSCRKERASVYWTNFGLLCFTLGMSWLIGFVPFLLIVGPVVALASTIGIWLFYVQHQYEDTYWEHAEEWDFETACLVGSSYYKLPKVLQWATASIGLHHIHHLDHNIPNYRLQQCLDENPDLQHVRRLTLWESFGCMWYKLWDEDQRKMVGFPKRHKPAKNTSENVAPSAKPELAAAETGQGQ